MAVQMKHIARLTVEEFYSRPDIPEKFVELIEGEVVAKYTEGGVEDVTPAGWRHADVTANISGLFHTVCQERKGIKWYPDNTGFVLGHNPDTVFCPDVSLFRVRPLSSRPWLDFSPEVAVEVLSPSNTNRHIAFKRQRYLSAGSEQVWVADPLKREMRIYFQDGRELSLSGDAEVDGEGILEGTKIRLIDIFSET